VAFVYGGTLTTLSVQLDIYATNSMAKFVHPITVVKITIKGFRYLPGMDSSNMKNTCVYN